MSAFLKRQVMFILITLFSGAALTMAAINKPLIFPIPLKTELHSGQRVIDQKTVILLPRQKNSDEAFIAALLQAELGDKYRIPLFVHKTAKLTENTDFILMGTLENPLIKAYCQEKGLTEKVQELGGEGYLILVNESGSVVAANTQQGVLYGLQSLRQLLKKEKGKVVLPFIKVEDKPRLPFRAVKLYLPGRDNIAFFKRFVRDFLVKYQYNKVMLELNANIRLESHPELNVGTLDFADDLNYSRRDRPAGPHKEYQNSSHQDNADGDILEKWEVVELVNYISRFNIEIIPEMPSLTHAYYLLFGHKDLAELPDREYPDTYCPLKPENYTILFDVFDEYMEIFQPKMVNIGHDEWRMEKDVCKLCKGKDYSELFANDVKKIYDYFAAKGIEVSMWGDHLLESVRQKDFRVWKTKTGYEYKIPGAMKPEHVRDIIPKDIISLNWFYARGEGIGNDLQLAEMGFRQVYGNSRANIPQWEERLKKVKGVLGGMVSSWAATTEFNLGKDQMFDFLGCSNLLWSEHYKNEKELSFITQHLMPSIHEDLSGETPPSRLSLYLEVKPIDLTERYNSNLNAGIDSIPVASLVSGELRDGRRLFRLSAAGKRAVVVRSNETTVVEGIAIGEDVSSIIFLHASAQEAYNQKAYRAIYNFDDTAELLGWYEVVYDDGYMETIPLRYGVNILDWQTNRRIINGKKGKSRYAQNKYAYTAKLIPCSRDESKPIDFFAYEWKNVRLGNTIKEIRLKAAQLRKGHENAIILLAVSVVGKKNIENIKVIEDE